MDNAHNAFIALKTLAPTTGGAIQTVQELEAAMLRHDWTYMYSDDHRVWREGERSLARLRSGSDRLRAGGLGQQVDALWERYNTR